MGQDRGDAVFFKCRGTGGIRMRSDGDFPVIHRHATGSANNPVDGAAAAEVAEGLPRRIHLVWPHSDHEPRVRRWLETC